VHRNPILKVKTMLLLQDLEIREQADLDRVDIEIEDMIHIEKKTIVIMNLL
jgi:hypothetical protein